MALQDTTVDVITNSGFGTTTYIQPPAGEVWKVHGVFDSVQDTTPRTGYNSNPPTCDYGVDDGADKLPVYDASSQPSPEEWNAGIPRSFYVSDTFEGYITNPSASTQSFTYTATCLATSTEGPTFDFTKLSPSGFSNATLQPSTGEDWLLIHWTSGFTRGTGGVPQFSLEVFGDSFWCTVRDTAFSFARSVSLAYDNTHYLRVKNSVGVTHPILLVSVRLDDRGITNHSDVVSCTAFTLTAYSLNTSDDVLLTDLGTFAWQSGSAFPHDMRLRDAVASPVEESDVFFGGDEEDYPQWPFPLPLNDDLEIVFHNRTSGTKEVYMSLLGKT